MTKTQYRAYIQSDGWRQFRKFVLFGYPFCQRCNVPRWLAEIVYDQDLHVHHLHYRTVGHESVKDVEVLCRRCHEIETFGRSELRELKRATCSQCKSIHFDYRRDMCLRCVSFEEGVTETLDRLESGYLVRDSDGRIVLNEQNREYVPS